MYAAAIEELKFGLRIKTTQVDDPNSGRVDRDRLRAQITEIVQAIEQLGAGDAPGELAAIRALLRRLMWKSDGKFELCRMCGAVKPRHTEDCDLANAVKELHDGV